MFALSIVRACASRSSSLHFACVSRNRFVCIRAQPLAILLHGPSCHQGIAVKMSKQASLRAFFSDKRPLSDAVEGAPRKVAKTEDASCVAVAARDEKLPLAVTEAPTSPLTQEQIDRMERNRLEALARRQKREGPEGSSSLTSPLGSRVVSPLPSPGVLPSSSVVNASDDLLALERATMGPTWFEALKKEMAKPYYAELKKFVAAERRSHTIYPAEKDVFSWSRFCDVKKIKVVIIGQDPYINPNQAHGLCFSVPPTSRPPPSLLNIYKELETDIEGFKAPSHGNLEAWAKQGVLLLNAALTVRAGASNSHANKGWEKFTDAVIEHVNAHCPNVAFLLWGAYAQKKCRSIDKKRHLALEAVHPSPLSVHRGFFGCRHFSKANAFLASKGLEPIDWSAVAKSQ